ncbi:unnamed protein product [Lymnaea stagnalis]|uniref:Uncharacterized protein n=1 Tax=Lymnaea stagnalis TaxID=6523 RepID=A0AAV2IFG7_LYMST
MGAGAMSGACSGSKSTDIVVLAVHINTPESLTEIILGLELPALETLSAISLLRSNFRLFSHMKTSVEAVIYLRVKYHKNCVKKLKDLNSVYLPEADLNILGQFLGKILFGKASVDKYRSIINEASLRHYDPQRILENVKIHEDSKLILKEIRELWLNFSSWSPEFAVHLTAVGVLSELVQNIGSLVDSHGVISF